MSRRQWGNSNDKFNIPVGIALFIGFFILVIWIAPMVSHK